MEIYLGGHAQGKLSCVLERYPDKTKIAEGSLTTEELCGEAEIIRHFHLYIRKFGSDWERAWKSVDKIITSNPSVILICDEIGCGIVPMKKEERDYRESVGRVMCRAVRRADRVERVICGISSRIR